MLNQLIGLCRRDMLKYRSVMFLLPLALLLLIALAHLMSSFTLTGSFFGQERFVTIYQSGDITSTFFSSSILYILLVVLIQCYYFTDVYFSSMKEKSDLFWRTLPIFPGLDIASKLIVPILFMLFFIVMMALFDLYDFAVDKVILANCTDCVMQRGHEAVGTAAYLAYLLTSIFHSLLFMTVIYFGLLPIFTFLLLLSSISKIHPAWLIVIYLALSSVTGLLNMTEILPDAIYIFFSYLDIIFTQALHMPIFENAEAPLTWPYSAKLSASIIISTLFLNFATFLSRSARH